MPPPDDARPDAPRPDDARAALVATLTETASRLGTQRLTIGVFCAEAGVTMEHIYRHCGSWQGLCAAAGLAPTVWKTRVPDAEIFAAMRDCFVEAGGIVTRSRFERGFAYSSNLITRRWRTWRGALAAFRDWAAENEPDFPHTDALRTALVASAGKRRAAPPGVLRPPWPAHDGAHPSGPPLGFRAMLHAPANEQGVVLLFGMVAADLGYAVDAVAAGFPDCEARRIVGVRGGAFKGSGGAGNGSAGAGAIGTAGTNGTAGICGTAGAEARWQAVRVEFEYRSRGFRDHRHDPSGCDVIVCWEHDWPDCPLEVLELKSAIAGLNR